VNVHEYQAKDLFRKHGIPTPLGIPALSVGEAVTAAQKLIEETGDETVVVKAQIHAGGRGKAGGVKVVRGVEAAKEAAASIFGQTLVTHQTGPAGKVVQRLLVEQGVAIDRELYLALVVDRESRRVVVMASTEGGVDIEEVAANTPDKILKVAIDPAVGLQAYQARQIAFGLGLDKPQQKQLIKLLGNLASLFMAEDCSLAEINPLIVTQGGDVVALDGKLTLDDNADFRHPEWADLRDLSEEAPTETEAKAAGLSYVQLDGNIGCLVNGAGLAMSTMDIIKHVGGEPANFLDVGGSASEEAVTEAFRIILSDDSVKGILVNIFGGIMRCDVIAQAVVNAAKEVGFSIPLVVRLEGTNVEEGKKILEDARTELPTMQPGDDLGDAARKIAEAVGTAKA